MSTAKATSSKSRVSSTTRNRWTLEELYALPQEKQITRHICVEGWSAIGSWTGVRLSDFPATRWRRHAREVRLFHLRRGLFNTIDMPTALHPQTQMTLKFADEILPRKYGFPMKIRMPTKLGFKNPKYVVSLVVTNDDRGGYWEDQRLQLVQRVVTKFIRLLSRWR